MITVNLRLFLLWSPGRLSIRTQRPNQHVCFPTAIPKDPQDTGIPGDGLVGDKLQVAREGVFRLNWYAIIPPSPQEMSQIYKAQQDAPMVPELPTVTPSSSEYLVSE